ncbi:MAG: Ig-like domain-containing protein, partial [Eggerthellaceae bacterium]|nr:Ig-like domain-containing protein [Eggerthellaceae bacterium]
MFDSRTQRTANSPATANRQFAAASHRDLAHTAAPTRQMHASSHRDLAHTAAPTRPTHDASLTLLVILTIAAMCIAAADALFAAPGQAFAAERFPQLASEANRTDAVPVLIEVELDSAATKDAAMKAVRYWREDALKEGIVTDAELAESGTTRDEYLNGFQWSSELETIAIQRSAETRVFWDHIRPDGSSCFSLSDLGYLDEETDTWVEGTAHLDSSGEVISSTSNVTGGIDSFASERFAYIREKAGEEDVGATVHYTFLVLNFTSKSRGTVALYGFGNPASTVGEGGTYSTEYVEWTNKPAGYKGTYDVTVRVKDFTCTDYWGDQRTFDVSMKSTISEPRIKVSDTASISTRATITKDGYEVDESYEKMGEGFRVAADGVQYESSNEAVAKVSSDGTVTGVGEGSATITVRAGSETSSVKVEVVQPKPVSIEKPQLSTLLGKKPALPETVEVTWNIGDPTKEPVTWDDYDSSKLNAKGTFTVQGKVSIASYGGFERTTQATCKVEANVARLAGQDALKTMQHIVGFNAAKPREYGNAFEDKRGGTVIVATSEGYWDVLTASALAGMEDACVLMTAPDALSPEARAEVER